MKRRRYIETAIAALTTGTLAGCGDGEDNQTRGTGTPLTGNGTQTATAMATVSFKSQTINDPTITVQSVTLPHDGYVAIHTTDKSQNTSIGSVISASRYLHAGTHKNVQVGLFKVSGNNFNPDTLKHSQRLSAVAHRETNDNQTFDYRTTKKTEDGPYYENNSIVADVAYINIQSQTKTMNTQANLGLARSLDPASSG
jgi:hypothetical protein